MVTNYHRKHIKELGVPKNIEAYIQSSVLRKTLESVSFEFRRGFKDDGQEEIAKAARWLSEADTSPDILGVKV